MSKKSRKRNKKILAVLGLAAAATAASRRNKGTAADVDSGRGGDSASAAARVKANTPVAPVAPVAPIGPRAVNVAASPKRSNASIAKRSSRGVGDYPDYTAAPTRVNGVQIKGRLNAQPTTPFSPAQGNRKKTIAEVLSGGDTRGYKSGGRTGYSAGGAAKRGISPILLKGKK